MTDRPILFSAPMVRALLDGTKTQTRRLIELPEWTVGMYCTGRLHMYERQACHERHGLEFLPVGRTLWNPETNPTGASGAYLRIPIMTGDRLYVREHWKTDRAYEDLAPRDMGGEEPLIYLADNEVQRWGWKSDPMSLCGRHRQAMHMPRWASRLTLTVTDVRVQRLQDITNADAVAEGIERWIASGATDNGFRDYLSDDPSRRVAMRPSFRSLWDSLNADRAPWADNPWVAAYGFKVQHGNIDQVAVYHPTGH